MRAFVVGNYMNANFMQVERLPVPGESVSAQSVFREHGGKGLNLGVGLHRLGVVVDLLMAVGSDEVGVAVTEKLRAEAMRTDWVLTLDAVSGFGVGFIAADGNNFLAAYQGANARLNADHVASAEQDLRQADWVLAQFEVPDAPVFAAFQRAHTAGRKTYLNPSPWRAISPELLELTDILVVNAAEAACLFDYPNATSFAPEHWIRVLPQFARQIGWSGELLVVTLAEAGCAALSRDGEIYLEPAYQIDQIDATGAGDAFGCGLIFGLLREMPVAQALRFANACGAIIAASSGIFDHLPTAAAVEKFMGR